MNYVKSGVATAIIFAATVFGGNAAYADDTSDVVVARDPNQIQTVSVETKEPQIIDVTVQAGDNISSIARKYGTTVDDIVQRNAITNPNVIEIGTVLKLASIGEVAEETAAPYDQLKAAASAFITPPAPVVVAAPAATARSTTRSYSSAPVNSSSYYVGNGMWCTDYVHSRRPDVPIYGNAGYNWISAAQAQGRATGTTPRAGAVAVMNGHVAYVESVNGDGSYTVSEMGWNYKAGNYNQRTVGAGAFGGFIY